MTITIFPCWSFSCEVFCKFIPLTFTSFNYRILSTSFFFKIFFYNFFNENYICLFFYCFIHFSLLLKSWVAAISFIFLFFPPFFFRCIVIHLIESHGSYPFPPFLKSLLFSLFPSLTMPLFLCQPRPMILIFVWAEETEKRNEAALTGLKFVFSKVYMPNKNSTKWVTKITPLLYSCDSSSLLLSGFQMSS